VRQCCGNPHSVSADFVRRHPHWPPVPLRSTADGWACRLAGRGGRRRARRGLKDTTGRAIRPVRRFAARAVNGAELKSYQTSLGFFDQAIAAPSMMAPSRPRALPAISSIRERPRKATIRTLWPRPLGSSNLLVGRRFPSNWGDPDSEFGATGRVRELNVVCILAQTPRFWRGQS
jgi:hypothetical protein